MSDEKKPVLVRSMALQYVLVGNVVVASLLVTDSDGTAIPAEGGVAFATAMMMLTSMQEALDKQLITFADIVPGGVAFVKPKPTTPAKAN